MSTHLALRLLGPPKLDLDDAPMSLDRRKTLALLAYLALNPGGHTRDFLSALLWPNYDQTKAFKNLRHTLWETQQAIGEGWIVVVGRETIALDANADPSAGRILWVDVASFESLVAQSRAQNDASLRIPLLSDSVKLYRNHFLTGFSLKDAPGFNEWAFAESEDLRQQLAGALTMLTDDHCSLGEAETAISYARRLTALDPLNEASHRRLMQVYLQAGQPNAALKQYQACEKTLRQELGLDPQPEMRALYKQIRKGAIKPIQPIKQKEIGAPQHNISLQPSIFVEREKEQNETLSAAEGVAHEKAEKEQRAQLVHAKTWVRLKNPALFLGVVLASVLLWRLIPALIPADALMPFPQKDGMKLHYVPAGPFIMGGDNGVVDEKPVHKVTLDAFWIDETEVTNAMYALCVAAGDCQPPIDKSSGTRPHYYDEKQYADYPVIYVSWNDAKTYCAWAGRALPSEAQWEKAARGTDGRTYPWGNGTPNKDLLNYNENIGDTTEVDIYPNGKSPHGALDMAGNVWEWMSDGYDDNYYANSPSSNPLGPSGYEPYRVVRGGSWAGNDGDVRSTRRYRINPNGGYGDFGFRCALPSP